MTEKHPVCCKFCHSSRMTDKPGRVEICPVCRKSRAEVRRAAHALRNRPAQTEDELFAEDVFDTLEIK